MNRSKIYSEGLVGHQAVIERLEGLLAGDRLPHALLFSGPAGVGKSFVARWVAASFLSARTGGEEGQHYQRALSGNHPDFHRVSAEEGKRDIVIAQMRELMAKISLKPFETDRKAALVDEAERLNLESQNAFLKTLEEPPADTLIILVSSAADRLLPTILSRCQRFRFSRLSNQDLDQFMAQRLEGECTLPETLAEGSPGRFLELIEGDAARPIQIFFEFFVSPSLPSPVKSTSALMDWASEGSKNKNATREKLRFALRLAAGVARDLLILLGGAENRLLLNGNKGKELLKAVDLYNQGGLFRILQEMVESYEDIVGYVDPGLVIENCFRTIRDARK